MPRIAKVLMLSALAGLTGPHPVQAAELAPALVLRHHLADATGVSAAGHFDPSFLKLDADNQRLFDGLDVLDADPVCQCQDSGGHYRITGHTQGPDRYVATVNRDGEPGHWQVIMHRNRGTWTFYDVIDDRGSVRALLQRHNTCARERLARHQSVDPCAELK